MTTYIVTGRDTGIPLLDYTGVLTGLNIGDSFTTTLSGGLEAKMIGAGLIAKAPIPAHLDGVDVTFQGGSTDDVLTRQADGSWKPAPSSGGSGGSARRTVKCPFAFNTANLLTGAVLYTPTLGDVLYDAWFEIVTAWNGSPALGDIGSFSTPGSNGAFFTTGGGAIDMTSARHSGDFSDLILAGFARGSDLETLSQFTILSMATDALAVSGASVNWQTGGGTNGSRWLPATCIAADPIKVLVSADGTNTGADPGATAGAAILYLDIDTPVAP